MDILIVTGSPRKHGNTETMAEIFAAEAEKQGHKTCLFRLSEKRVLPCKSCGHCRLVKGRCLLHDDMESAFELIRKNKIIVFASPIYDHGFSAQMVAFFNRLNAYNGLLYGPAGSALLLDSGLPDEFEAASVQYKAIASERRWEDMGIVTISGMREKGDMMKSPDLRKLSALAEKLGGCND